MADLDLTQVDLSMFPPAERAVLEEYLRRQTIREKGGAFLPFVKHVAPWFVVEEVHCLIADHLEQLRRGEIDRLMIQMAPRTGKSLMTSELFPAWWAGQFPGDKILHASYASTLVEKFGRKIRNMLMSGEYAEIFPKTQVSKDSRSAGQWATTAGGEYNAVGVGGGVAGKGGNLLLCDDPISEQDAFSASVMQSVWDWWGSGFYTRRQPDRNVFLLTMCMTGDTPVLMADGTEKPLVDVRPGDSVATYDDGKLAVTKVVKHQSSGWDTVFTIHLRSGRGLRANERHPFLVDFGGEQLWVRVKDLKSGMGLVSLKAASVIATTQTSCECYSVTTATSRWGALKRPKPQNLSLDTCDFTVDEIVSIEETGYEEVFDVEIDRTENFIANGVVSHNTRWRHDDVVGRLLADAATVPGADQWVQLKIPAILDEESAEMLNRYSNNPFVEEPHHYRAGDSFSPRRWPINELMRTKAAVGRKAWASLYLQSPVAEGGGIIMSDWWKPWKSDKLPKFTYIIQSYDTAFEEGAHNDFSARTTLGVFRRDSDGRQCAMVIERMKERLSFPDLLDNALQSYKEYKPDRIVVEKAASGIPLIQEMRKRGVPVSPIPPKGSKIARAHAAAILFEQGVVYYPQDRRWARELIEEVAAFPDGGHDDSTDSLVHGVNYIRRLFLLETPEDVEDNDDDEESQTQKRTYAVRRTRIGASHADN